MMCKLFEEWSSEIREYCLKNGFSFEKAKVMSKNWHKDDLLILAYDDHNSEKGKTGLLDDTPMPAVLIIESQPDGTLRFEQTEHTEKYLRDDLSSERERKIG